MAGTITYCGQGSTGFTELNGVKQPCLQGPENTDARTSRKEKPEGELGSRSRELSYLLDDREYSVAQSCWTLCDPMDCSPPGSSAHGSPQARVLEWVAMPSSRESF